MPAGFIGKMYGIIDVIHEVVDRFTLYNVETTPREFSSMVMLVRDALLEMKKVLDYTGDVAANYMKNGSAVQEDFMFLRNGEMNFIGKKSAVFLRKNNLLPI